MSKRKFDGPKLAAIDWSHEVPKRRGAPLWHFVAPSQETVGLSSQCPSPATELRRARLVARLRERYAVACSEVLGLEKPPADSLDRWLLEQLSQPHSDKNSSAVDPFFLQPTVALESQVLTRELLAEVPLRCPTRMFGNRALIVLKEYHHKALQWLNRCEDTEAVRQLRKEVEALGSWLDGEGRTFARRRGPADECPLRQRLRQLPETLGKSFQELARPLADKVAAILSDETLTVVKEMGSLGNDQAEKQENVVHLEQTELGMTVRYADDALQLSRLHHAKLRALFEVHNPHPTGSCPEEKEFWENTFRRALYVMLRRYVTFIGLDPSVEGQIGGNMHAAAPETAFDWLREELGVQAEGFASPLNCYFATFCSAFPDTDSVFGSVGSFFDFWPPEGSFEVGPPYTEEVMESMAKHLLKLLETTRASGAPMSFVVFVPDWSDPPCSALEILDGQSFSSFRRTRGGPCILLEGRRHHYISGVQFFADKGHNADQRYYVVPHGQRAYVLQNDSGAKKWPFTPQREAELLERLAP